MNIVINGRFLTRRMTGVDRFAREVVLSIDEMIRSGEPAVKGLHFCILMPPNAEPDVIFSHVELKSVGTYRGQMWEQFDLPIAAANADILLNLCNTGPIFLTKQIVVIHDAATSRVPIAFSRSFRLWYSVLMPILGKMARRVLTVSNFSRNEIRAVFKIPFDKTSVISEGGEHILRAPPEANAISRFRLTSRPFILAVSSMAAHKNFKLVLEALALIPNPPFDVAIAGGANAKVFGNAGDLRSNSVRWLGYVSDAELRTLYESAMCFIFPSVYEGFGIPPLEAMHCGCPVIAARAASIPEVCGDSALYFDPYDASELAELLLKVASDPVLRSDMSAKGRKRADLFSWDRATRDVLSVCREAVN